MKKPNRKFDKEASALYIQYSNAQVCATEKFTTGIFLDLSSNNRLIGVEFLFCSDPKDPLIDSTLKRILQKYSIAS